MTLEDRRPNRSYGRIKSRAIKPAQGALLDSLLPRIALPDPTLGPIDPAALSPDSIEVWLEIGFGGGEHLAAQAARHSQVLYLGAEPFLNGAASALRHIDQSGSTNVRLHIGDARPLIEALPDHALARIFILFPDPWPKSRHHKRRLVQSDLVAELARVLKPGGRLRFATDWSDYADWALQRFIAHPAFRWRADSVGDWRTPPDDHITTRYQEKRLGDIDPVFLEIDRV